MSAPAIEIEGLQFAWRGREPLLRLDRLSVARGERLFLQGPSGSGKSTLLGLIGGVLVPQSGTVRLIGTALSSLSSSARDRFRGEHVGFIFQMFNLIPYLSVLENVLLPLGFSPGRRARIKDSTIEPEGRRLLAALGLSGDDLMSRPITELSIGQQQRVAAARALIGRPEILIADEPTSALDAEVRGDFLRLVMAECRAFGTTLVFVSHDSSLGTHFDRVVALREINRAVAQAA